MPGVALALVHQEELRRHVHALARAADDLARELLRVADQRGLLRVLLEAKTLVPAEGGGWRACRPSSRRTSARPSSLVPFSCAALQPEKVDQVDGLADRLAANCSF
jgi:hypothetical protein